MFAVPNNQKCPARAYKVYAEKRPAEMETHDAPFTLTVNNVKSGNNDVPQTDIMQLSGHKNGYKVSLGTLPAHRILVTLSLDSVPEK